MYAVPKYELNNLVAGGSFEDVFSLIPEKTIDEIIYLLELNPETEWHYPHPNYRTLKQKLWLNIGAAIIAHSKPTPKHEETTPTHIKNFLAQKIRNVEKVTEFLKSLQYENIYTKDRHTKVAIVATEMRINSSDENVYSFGSAQNFYDKENDEWPVLCQFDQDLRNTLENLVTIQNRLQKLLDEKEDKANNFSPKDDMLLFSLCWVYREFTGKEPISNSTGEPVSVSKQVTGNVVQFLQKILPYTLYDGKCTDVALMGKIKRMRKNPKYSNLWQNK